MRKFWLIAAVILGAILILRAGSDGSKDASNQEQAEEPPSVVELLDSCSPFNSLDGARMLEFDREKHSVKLTEAVGDERKGGALTAEHPKVADGAWSADEDARTVLIDLEGAKTTYTMVTASNGALCILAQGQTTSVNLEASWFGTYAPDEHPDPPELN